MPFELFDKLMVALFYFSHLFDIFSAADNHISDQIILFGEFRRAKESVLAVSGIELKLHIPDGVWEEEFTKMDSGVDENDGVTFHEFCQYAVREFTTPEDYLGEYMNKPWHERPEFPPRYDPLEKYSKTVAESKNLDKKTKKTLSRHQSCSYIAAPTILVNSIIDEEVEESQHGTLLRRQTTIPGEGAHHHHQHQQQPHQQQQPPPPHHQQQQKQQQQELEEERLLSPSTTTGAKCIISQEGGLEHIYEDEDQCSEVSEVICDDAKVSTPRLGVTETQKPQEVENTGGGVHHHAGQQHQKYQIEEGQPLLVDSKLSDADAIWKDFESSNETVSKSFTKAIIPPTVRDCNRPVWQREKRSTSKEFDARDVSASDNKRGVIRDDARTTKIPLIQQLQHPQPTDNIVVPLFVTKSAGDNDDNSDELVVKMMPEQQVELSDDTPRDDEIQKYSGDDQTTAAATTEAAVLRGLARADRDNNNYPNGSSSPSIAAKQRPQSASSQHLSPARKRLLKSNSFTQRPLSPLAPKVYHGRRTISTEKALRKQCHENVRHHRLDLEKKGRSSSYSPVSKISSFSDTGCSVGSSPSGSNTNSSRGSQLFRPGEHSTLSRNTIKCRPPSPVGKSRASPVRRTFIPLNIYGDSSGNSNGQWANNCSSNVAFCDDKEHYGRKRAFTLPTCMPEQIMEGRRAGDDILTHSPSLFFPQRSSEASEESSDVNMEAVEGCSSGDGTLLSKLLPQLQSIWDNN